MYSDQVRAAALDLLASGMSSSEVSRRTGVNRSTLRAWQSDPGPKRRPDCPICNQGVPLDPAAYSALLGFYLGDGCISTAPRYFSLRVCCDAGWPSIIDDVEAVVRRVRPGANVHLVSAPGCVVVQSNWKHWPCLFPQHGAGRKHERPIVLEPWQQDIVDTHPADFLRGLFHSDGARVTNWTTKDVGGERKRYDYPRWQFTNVSDDIRGLCCNTLDRVGVAWRRSNAKTISVARRADVARLDELIGPKR